MQGNLKELIQIIESKASIVDVVSDYVSLEKKGNNYVGLCPFHSDSNPSMSVSDAKGIFKCFSCGAAGGSLSFVQNYEGISFIEAVKKVSDRYGINWKNYITHKEVKINPEEKRGWEINSEAVTFFSYALNNIVGSNVTNYIKSRDLNEEVVSKFKIGFSGDGSSLTSFLINKGFSEDEIIKYGLGKRRDDSSMVDYFINRLMFPIEDRNGNVIGFSGRIIEESKYAKYLNSPETPIFKKSKILYNLNNAKISANLKKELIVVEGFMDVISLYKSGIENAIATMGTAFTKHHSEEVKRITNNITLAFDSDAPGINATIATGKELLKSGVNVSAISIPAGKDFDELFKLGKQTVVDTLENKTNFLKYYKDKIYSKLDQDMENISFEILRELIKVIGLYNDEMLIDSNLNEISEKYKVSKDILLKELGRFKKENNTNQGDDPYLKEYIPQEPKSSKQTPDYSNDFKSISLRINQEVIVAYALQNNEAFEYLCENPIGFTIPELSELWTTYKNFKKSGATISDDNILNKIELITNSDYSKKLNNSLVEIENMKDYALTIESYNDLFKNHRKVILLKEIAETNDIDEKKHLTNLLRKLID